MLPFQNLGPAGDEYFADGVTDELTSRLATVEKLGVISHTSAVQYKSTTKSVRQIGAELGVDYVLEGTVRWQRAAGGGRVRVTPQLIRVRDDTHIWASSYDRDLQEIFAVQSEIASRVIEALEVALGARERPLVEERPTRNMEAYDFYLKGLDEEAKGSGEATSRKTLGFMEKAAAADPGFWWAQLGVAVGKSWIYHGGYDRSREPCERAERALQRAETLAPGHPLVHRARGYMLFTCFRDFDQALAELALAARALPNDPAVLTFRAAILRRRGQFEAAAALFERVCELDPRNGKSAMELAYSYSTLGRYADARRWDERAVQLNPADAEAQLLLAKLVLRLTGQPDSALAVLAAAEHHLGAGDDEVRRAWVYYLTLARKYEAAQRRVVPGRTLDGHTIARPASLEAATLYGLMGHRDEAARAYENARMVLAPRAAVHPDDPRLAAALGEVYAGLGRTQEARAAAARAVDLLPVSSDAYSGPEYVYAQARTLTMLGAEEEAIDRLESLREHPSTRSSVQLRLEPWWDPLRNNPRFQRLLRER